jgi:hypothetical protein
MAAARRRRSTPAKPVWKQQGARVKFRYTQPDHAAAILAEQTFRVPTESKRRLGLYVTTVAPGEMTDDRLRNLLFAGGRDRLFIEGAVILRDDAWPGRRSRRPEPR